MTDSDSTSTDGEPPQAEVEPELSDGSTETTGVTSDLPLSRRGLFAGALGLGLLAPLGSAVPAAASEGTTLQFGSNVVGTQSSGYGLRLETDNGHGLVGYSTDTSPGSSGVYGLSEAEQGYGLHGRALHQTGKNFGMWGLSKSSQGIGVYGKADNSSGETYGVQGVAESPNGTGVRGVNWSTGGSGTAQGVYGLVVDEGDGTTGVRGHAAASSGQTYGVKGEVDSPDGYGLYTPDDAQIDGQLTVDGDLNVKGTKHFVQAVETAAGPKNVAYNAVEAGKAHTETNDVAEMEDGRAVVELPDHFGMVTSDSEPLTIQVTPYAKEAVQPQVVDQSTDRIVVEDFGDGPDDYTFAYTVKGVREGFEDEPVVRDP